MTLENEMRLRKRNIKYEPHIIIKIDGKKIKSKNYPTLTPRQLQDLKNSKQHKYTVLNLTRDEEYTVGEKQDLSKMNYQEKQRFKNLR